MKLSLEPSTHSPSLDGIIDRRIFGVLRGVATLDDTITNRRVGLVLSMPELLARLHTFLNGKKCSLGAEIAEVIASNIDVFTWESVDDESEIEIMGHGSISSLCIDDIRELLDMPSTGNYAIIILNTLLSRLKVAEDKLRTLEAKILAVKKAEETLRAQLAQLDSESSEEHEENESSEEREEND